MDFFKNLSTRIKSNSTEKLDGSLFFLYLKLRFTNLIELSIALSAKTNDKDSRSSENFRNLLISRASSGSTAALYSIRPRVIESDLSPLVLFTRVNKDALIEFGILSRNLEYRFRNSTSLV
jgi:hypothetical protein